MLGSCIAYGASKARQDRNASSESGGKACPLILLMELLSS